MKGLVLALCVLAVLLQAVTASGSTEQVRLEDVQVLTLYKGKQTAARRVSAIPQLHCISGDGCGYHDLQPEVMQCRNMGSDGRDVQWRCEADLDDKVRLGAVEVLCEGYKYPDDPFILKGSCGVEYELKLTEKGRQALKYGGSGGRMGGGGGGGGGGGSDSAWGNFVWIVWLVIFGIIFYSFLQQCFRPSVPRPTAAPYPSAPPLQEGYYNDGTGLYPPPPTPYPPSSMGGAPYVPPPAPSGGGGGFWTGAATGGFLGYLFGRGNQRYNYGYAYNPTSSWGTRSTYSVPASRSSGSSHSSGSSSRTSAGFGGTRRR